MASWPPSPAMPTASMIGQCERHRESPGFRSRPLAHSATNAGNSRPQPPTPPETTRDEISEGVGCMHPSRSRAVRPDTVGSGAAVDVTDELLAAMCCEPTQKCPWPTTSRGTIGHLLFLPIAAEDGFHDVKVQTLRQVLDLESDPPIHGVADTNEFRLRRTARLFVQSR